MATWVDHAKWAVEHLPLRLVGVILMVIVLVNALLLTYMSRVV